MTLATVELRCMAWLLMATVAFLLLAWSARYAPWLLWVPAWRVGRRIRR